MDFSQTTSVRSEAKTEREKLSKSGNSPVVTSDFSSFWHLNFCYLNNVCLRVWKFKVIDKVLVMVENPLASWE
tara:strand:- start:683 stop:901 length:219 start_codon:yes stop_codon:yes gene_type:complete